MRPQRRLNPHVKNYHLDSRTAFQSRALFLDLEQGDVKEVERHSFRMNPKSRPVGTKRQTISQQDGYL